MFAPKKIRSDSIFHWTVTTAAVGFGLLCFFPFWLIFINSFADSGVLNTKGFRLLPDTWSFDSYRYLFTGNRIYRSYSVSLAVTAIGTILGTLMASMYAYSLSHRKVRYGSVLSFLTYFTMIMGSGLVGFYLLMVNWLDLKNNLLAMVLPYLLNPFYVFVLMAYFRTLPYEIYESASLDSGNDIYIFFRIILPISKPVLATIALFYALQYWNDWWLALLFIDVESLHPLQVMIRKVIELSYISNYVTGKTEFVVIPSEGIKLSTTIVTIGPIIFIYPFIQKYFVKGITLGAVKG